MLCNLPDVIKVALDRRASEWFVVLPAEKDKSSQKRIWWYKATHEYIKSLKGGWGALTRVMHGRSLTTDSEDAALQWNWKEDYAKADSLALILSEWNNYENSLKIDA